MPTLADAVLGIRMLRHPDDDGERGRQAVLRVLRRVVPITETYDGQRFFSRQNGSRVATTLYLKPGLAVILVGVGAKMLLLDIYPVPILVSLAFIGFTLTVSVVASLRATRPIREPVREPGSEAASGLHDERVDVGVTGGDGGSEAGEHARLPEGP
jgi:hypothetical protein